jgi:hypothetical protein
MAKEVPIGGGARVLSFAQHVRLEKLPEETRVVGWSDEPRGPVIRYPNGQRRVVTDLGRLVVAKKAA